MNNFELVADVVNAAVRWRAARLKVLMPIPKGAGFEDLAEAEAMLSEAVEEYQAMCPLDVRQDDH